MEAETINANSTAINGGGADKSPLLRRGGSSRRLRRRNSANSLRTEFISRLPDKIRSALDPESYALTDLSKIKGLSQGTY